jgi:hypothetical protein
MDYTNQQKSAFKEQFAVRRKRQIALAIPLIVLIVAAAMTSDKRTGVVFGLPQSVAGPVFLAVMIGALLFSFRNWRCPACHKYLGKEISPRFCAKCGAALQ